MSATLTCIDCKHWRFDSGHPAYSEVTPGDNASSSCAKGHWEMDNYETETTYRKYLLTAVTCMDFEHVDFV